MAGGKTVGEAIEILGRSWSAEHEKNLNLWNEHLRRQQLTQGHEGNGIDNKETAPRDNTQPGSDEPPEWSPTPSSLDPRPSRHILARLEKREYVELWHFTAQGCQYPASPDVPAPGDTFRLVNTDEGLMLQKVGATSASSGVTKDEDLQWLQVFEGMKRLSECMGEHGWSRKEAQELEKFYLKLYIHPIQLEEYGPEAILRYQDRVCRDWVHRLKNGGAYAIGTVNDELLRDYQRQIGTEMQARDNVSSLQSTDEQGVNNSLRNDWHFVYSPLVALHLIVPFFIAPLYHAVSSLHRLHGTPPAHTTVYTASSPPYHPTLYRYWDSLIFCVAGQAK